MEENKKDACCSGGKCGCGKKWVRIVIAIAIAVIIFMLGVSAGAHLNRSRANRQAFYGQNFGAASCANGGCPMMRGGRGGYRGGAVELQNANTGATQVDQNGGNVPQAVPGIPAPVATSSATK